MRWLSYSSGTWARLFALAIGWCCCRIYRAHVTRVLRSVWIDECNNRNNDWYTGRSSHHVSVVYRRPPYERYELGNARVGFVTPKSVHPNNRYVNFPRVRVREKYTLDNRVVWKLFKVLTRLRTDEFFFFRGKMKISCSFQWGTVDDAATCVAWMWIWRNTTCGKPF